MKRTLFLTFLLTLGAIAAQAQPHTASGMLRIDSVRIIENWRTRDRVILQELGFRQGDLVSAGDLDTMIIRIWNIGNFAKVGYEIDSTAQGTLLTITAKDAFTIVPILSFNGNRDDWSLSLGMSDHNFLGRNIRFSIEGSFGTNDKSFRTDIRIPRQMLYRNMSVGGGLVYGKGMNYRFEDRERVSVVTYRKKMIYGSIGNPLNEDFRYRFSPDFSWSLFQHEADSALNDSGVTPVGNYKVNYLGISVSESAGYIRRRRHQKDGFLASVALGAGIGLDQDSPFYYTVSGNLQYHRLFNDIVQFSAKFSTGYTSSTVPSLLYYKGSNDVKGILTGEISGQAFYTMYLGAHFTYINRDWFAMEHSVYVNWGNGTDTYGALFQTAPLFGVGTGFRFNMPMIPWLGFGVYFTWSGKDSNWFRLEL